MRAVAKQSVRHATLRKKWEQELAATLSGLKLTRGSACSCVWRGHIKGEDIVATVRGDDITIGGERSAVEFLIRMIKNKLSGKIRTLSGRILNRAIAWDRDGMTIEADQRHVREILEDLKLERANHSATPCAVERRDEGKGREPTWTGADSGWAQVGQREQQ